MASEGAAVVTVTALQFWLLIGGGVAGYAVIGVVTSAVVEAWYDAKMKNGIASDTCHLIGGFWPAVPFILVGILFVKARGALYRWLLFRLRGGAAGDSARRLAEAEAEGEPP